MGKGVSYDDRKRKSGGIQVLDSPAADILRGSRRRSGVEKARCRGFDGREERSPAGLRCAQNQFLYHRTHAASCLTLQGSQD